MSNIVVIYQSKYGATKKYANWLSEELSCDLIETKRASIDEIAKYDVIILGGGVYASSIAGISFLEKNYDKLKNKKIAVFAVGAWPYDEMVMENLRNRNFKGSLSNIPYFYCRGKWDESVMSWVDRVLCSALKKVIAKKKPAEYKPWESSFMQMIQSNHDWINKENLKPIISFVRPQ